MYVDPMLINLQVVKMIIIDLVDLEVKSIILSNSSLQFSLSLNENGWGQHGSVCRTETSLRVVESSVFQSEGRQRHGQWTKQ